MFLGTPGVGFFGVAGVPDKILSVSQHLLSGGVSGRSRVQVGLPNCKEWEGDL